MHQVQLAGLSTEGLHSKSWDEFAAPGAPRMDFVFTVCDNAARESCPLWPGQPMTAHWGVPDPAAVVGTPAEVARAYRDAFTILERRIRCCLRCRWRRSIRWRSSGSWTTLAARVCRSERKKIG